MTVLNRELVRDEIATGLGAAIAGSGLPVSTVYNHMPDKLDGESPVLLVLARNIKRKIAGMGVQRYDNEIGLEVQALVYEGSEDQPLTAAQREDKLDEIEQAVAAWCATHQIGTYYRALKYTRNESTEIQSIKYIDGNPYLMEITNIDVEAPDLA
jgi:hypothetical protein